MSKYALFKDGVQVGESHDTEFQAASRNVTKGNISFAIHAIAGEPDHDYPILPKGYEIKQIPEVDND